MVAMIDVGKCARALGDTHACRVQSARLGEVGEIDPFLLGNVVDPIWVRQPVLADRIAAVAGIDAVG